MMLFFKSVRLTKKLIVHAALTFLLASLLFRYYFPSSKNNQLEPLNQTVIGSKIWLNGIQQLAQNDKNSALELARYHLVRHNLARSNLDLAKNHSIKTSDKKALTLALYWFQHAISLGSEQARTELANHYFITEQYQSLLNLFQGTKPIGQQAILLAKTAIIGGDLAALNSLIEQLNLSTQGQLLIEQLKHYQIMTAADLGAVIDDLNPVTNNNKLNDSLRLASTNKSTNKQSQGCLVDMQIFATNLADLQLAEQLISGFQEHALASYFCFANVRYIPLTQLQCRHQPKEPIRCNEAIWQNYQHQITSRYLGILVPRGGANTHGGIIYLDNQDSGQVFAHELAHLLGFVDEYPLPAEHTACQSSIDTPLAHNLAVTKKELVGERAQVRKQVLTNVPWAKYIEKTTPILMPLLEDEKLTKLNNHNADMANKTMKWRVGTVNNFKGKIGLFASETCQAQALGDGHNYQAFKPVYDYGQQRYFELAFAPEYKTILAGQRRRFLMPSFQYNINKAVNNLLSAQGQP